ncbi:MAG: dihydropteroate synthase, partial [Lysobacteraceae bacterium]
MFDTTPTLNCGGRALRLDRPNVIGIVNITPDSFSGDGLTSHEAAIAHGLQLIAEGADALDVGGESTRPGAKEILVEEELRRVIPVIKRLARESGVPIFVDTSKPEVMRAAVSAGAGGINDVYALRRDGALDAAAELKVPVVLMHMQGDPATMQDDPRYDDVVADVHRFLAER